MILVLLERFSCTESCNDKRPASTASDPRLFIVPEEEWPHLLRGIAEVPPGWRLVRVDVDGSLSPPPYERGLTMTAPASTGDGPLSVPWSSP